MPTDLPYSMIRHHGIVVKKYLSKLTSESPSSLPIFLCLTGKPQLHSNGAWDEKGNELNQIPHPSESYHASGGSARAQLPAGMQDSSISFGKWGWENGTGGPRFRLLRLASSCQVEIIVGSGGFCTGRDFTPQIPAADAQLPR